MRGNEMGGRKEKYDDRGGVDNKGEGEGEGE
jgi:hypothetical protein